MAKGGLTDREVMGATAPPGKRIEIPDQGRHSGGLVLRVTDRGVKTWLVRYRTNDGVHRRYTLGRYPELSLADARKRAIEASGKARDGLDPSAEKRRIRAEARAQPLKTFQNLADAYFAASEIGEWKPRGKKKRASTLQAEKWLWGKHIESELGDLKLEDVTPAAIKTVLRGLVARGHHSTSNGARALIRQMFNFAIHEDRLAANPVAKIPPLGSVAPRTQVLRDEELRAVWNALGATAGLMKPSCKGGPHDQPIYIGASVAIAIKLLMLTAARRAEVAGMRRDELELEQAIWTIPGSRTKNGHTHVVPLGSEAVSLIREAIRLADEGQEKASPFVFPSPRDRSQSIGPGALTHAFGDLRKALALEGIRPHDIRRTVATIMASERLRISIIVISKLLNHSAETGGAARVTLTTYAQYNFISERREAIAAWEVLLMKIVSPSRDGAVDEDRPAAA